MHKSEKMLILTMQLNDRTQILKSLKEGRRDIEAFFKSDTEKTKQEIDKMLEKMRNNLLEYEKTTKELEDIAKQSLKFLKDLKQDK